MDGPQDRRLIVRTALVAAVEERLASWEIEGSPEEVALAREELQGLRVWIGQYAVAGILARAFRKREGPRR